MGRQVTVPVYLDANAIIRLAEYRDRSRVLDFLRRLDEAGVPVVTSEMSLAEVLVVPLREKDDALVRHYEALLVDGEGFLVMPVDRAVLSLSARFRASFGGKAPDAIHVASASLAGCRLIVSSDKRLRTPPEVRRIGVEELDKAIDLP